MVRLLRRRRPTTYPESVLAEAADLEKTQPVEAIRRLTEANRARPDRRIERRLLELRTSAYRSSRPAATPPWPESVEDRFPGELVPEIGPGDLDVETVRSAIHTHGSILVRGLVGPEDVQRLVTDIDTAFDAFDAVASNAVPPDLAGWYQRFEQDSVSDRVRRRSRGTLATVESPPVLFDVIEVLQKVGIGRLAEQYFGEQPALLARKATLRRLPHDGSGGWHQDGAFMGAGIRSLNVWLALTHCGDVAPGVDIAGRRFESLVQTGDTDGPKGGSGYANWGVSPANAAAAAGDTIVRPIFEPGDALIFDHLCLHRTASDPRMTDGRYAIETWLFAPSTYDAMTAPAAEGYSPRDQLPIYF